MKQKCMNCEQLAADVEGLNRMLRDHAYGQGAIDVYVTQCEDIDSLRAQVKMIRSMIQARIEKTGRHSSDAWLKTMLNRMDAFPLVLPEDDLTFPLDANVKPA